MRPLSLLALASIFSLSAGPASTSPPPDPPLRFAHASLDAYPNAEISFRDPDTGMTFYVESDGRRLVALDRDGRLAWGVDLFEAVGVTPRVGKPVIRVIRPLKDGTIWAVCGKHDFIKVDPSTGAASFWGSD
jgi:hypothetical protein